MARRAQDDRRPWTRLMLPRGEDQGRSPRPLGPLAALDRVSSPPSGRPGPAYRGPVAATPFSRGYFLDRYVY